VSSRSSTSSDLESFFPQRIGGQIYVASEDWRNEQEEGYEEVEDGEDEEIVERRAVCVFDFAAECPGEVSIEIGQVVWVEFRKGVSGWLVVRDEITGLCLFCSMLMEESKGLVPEGYVRFLNEDEERQYLEQSPPSNTLLPKDPIILSVGEDTPRGINQSARSRWNEEGDWVDDAGNTSGGEDWVGLTTGVEHVRVER
jgi:hypothetical protein